MIKKSLDFFILLGGLIIKGKTIIVKVDMENFVEDAFENVSVVIIIMKGKSL